MSDPNLTPEALQAMQREAGDMLRGAMAEQRVGDSSIEPGVLREAMEFHQRASSSPGAGPEANAEAQGRPEPTRLADGTSPDKPIPFDRWRQTNEQLKAAERQLAEFKAAREKEAARVAELEAKVRKAEQTEALKKALNGADRPRDFDSWSPEAQQQWQNDRLLEALVSMREETPRAAPQSNGELEKLREQVEWLALRQRLGNLSEPQEQALQEIRRSRSPQSDAELIAIARVVYPDLFDVEAGRPPASHQTQSPGRARAPRSNREPTSQDLERALYEAEVTQHDVLGGRILGQLAQEDPSLLFKGR